MTLHLLQFDQLHFIDFYYVRDANKALKPKSGLSYGDSKYLVRFLYVSIEFQAYHLYTFPTLREETI